MARHHLAAILQQRVPCLQVAIAGVGSASRLAQSGKCPAQGWGVSPLTSHLSPLTSHLSRLTLTLTQVAAILGCLALDPKQRPTAEELSRSLRTTPGTDPSITPTSLGPHATLVLTSLGPHGIILSLAGAKPRSTSKLDT